jgi:hypothetical protein
MSMPTLKTDELSPGFLFCPVCMESFRTYDTGKIHLLVKHNVPNGGLAT